MLHKMVYKKVWFLLLAALFVCATTLPGTVSATPDQPPPPIICDYPNAANLGAGSTGTVTSALGVTYVLPNGGNIAVQGLSPTGPFSRIILPGPSAYLGLIAKSNGGVNATAAFMVITTPVFGGIIPAGPPVSLVNIGPPHTGIRLAHEGAELVIIRVCFLSDQLPEQQ